MSSVFNLTKLSDFEYFSNIFVKCSQEVTSVSEYYESVKNLMVTGVGASTFNQSLPIFSNINDEIKTVKNLLDDEKFLDAITSINNYIFKNFNQIALLFQQTIHDETELPNVVNKLKENKLISENIFFEVLNTFLILDGLTSQVNMGESLSKHDFELLANALLVFQEINIVISTTSAYPLQEENLTTLTFNVASRVIVNSSFYSACMASTFSTSSRTVKQSSIVVLM